MNDNFEVALTIDHGSLPACKDCGVNDWLRRKMITRHAPPSHDKDSDDEAPSGPRSGRARSVVAENDDAAASAADTHFLLGHAKADRIHNSYWSSVIILLNSMIGSGILLQAYVFKTAGIGVALFLYVVFGTLTVFSVEVLLRAAHTVKVYDYADIAAEAFGACGNVLVDVSIVLMTGGALLSYILIIGSLLQTIVAPYAGAGSVYASAAFLTAVPVAVVVLPMCLVRHLGHLAAASYLSILAIVSVVALVLVQVRCVLGTVS